MRPDYSTVAWCTSPQIRLLHFESPDRPLPPPSLPPPPAPPAPPARPSLFARLLRRRVFRPRVSSRSRDHPRLSPDALSLSLSLFLSTSCRPRVTCARSLPLRRGELRVLTPRRMSGVMNFNSFTPRHVGVEGRAGGYRGQAKMATSFSPVKLSID